MCRQTRRRQTWTPPNSTSWLRAEPSTPDSCTINIAGDGPGPWAVDHGTDGMSSGEAASTPYSFLHSAFGLTNYLAATLCPPTTHPRRQRLSEAREWSVGKSLQVSGAAPPSCPRAKEESARRQVSVPEPTVPSGTDAGSIKSTWTLTSRPDPRVPCRVHHQPRLPFFQPDCDCYCPGLWHMDCWPVFPVFCRQA